LRRKTSIHDQIRLSDHGEILVSFFVLSFFSLPKRYKIAALASDISLRRATLYPAELRVHTVREVLTPCLRGIFTGLKSEPDIRSNRCLVTSFFQHQPPSPDLTSAFGAMPQKCPDFHLTRRFATTPQNKIVRLAELLQWAKNPASPALARAFRGLDIHHPSPIDRR
jgi:hypothetical protein